MRETARIVALMVVLSATATCAFAADWPWIYGPARDSTSNEKGLLRTWPAEGPKVLWTAPLGPGFGGPAVTEGKVYLLDRDEQIGDNLRVFDLSSGKELWSFAYDAPGTFMYSGSRTTPRSMEITSTSADPWETCTPSTRRRTSLSGTRTSGRTSAAVSCPGGPSSSIRSSTATW